MAPEQTVTCVARFLAYLGPVNFVSIDPDLVEETNLNRLVGAFPFDVGRPKVAVYAELLKK
jgi:tRNA A37 threonylcarbamoyladenosine dehydratase